MSSALIYLCAIFYAHYFLVYILVTYTHSMYNYLHVIHTYIGMASRGWSSGAKLGRL